MVRKKGGPMSGCISIKIGIPVVLIVCSVMVNEVKGGEGIEQPVVTKTLVSQSEVLKVQASRWSLKVDEYQNYLELMNGPLGKWSPNIDPLMALGMYADSSSQQRRYAELYAQQEFELTQRVLGFQQAYRSAFARMYPNQGILDKALLEPFKIHRQQKADSRKARLLLKQKIVDGDRLLLFVSIPCESCSRLLTQLMGLVSSVRNSGVDVYFLSVHDDTAIRDWIRAHHIRPEMIESKAITINRDEGLLERLQAQVTNPVNRPYSTFLKRDGNYYQINIKEFEL